MLNERIMLTLTIVKLICLTLNFRTEFMSIVFEHPYCVDWFYYQQQANGCFTTTGF